MDRATYIENLIKTWVEFPQMSCGWCGAAYDPLAVSPCCDKPFIATNKEILKQFIAQIEEDKQTRANVYASNKDKTMRWVVTMPPGLFYFINRRLTEKYNETLFNEKYPQSWFAKKFKKLFCVPELV